MKTHISKDAQVKTDLWTGYAPLEKDFVNMIRTPSGKKKEKTFQKCIE